MLTAGSPTSNILAFTPRPTQRTAPPLELSPEDRLGPPTPDRRFHSCIAVVAASIVVHGMILAGLWERVQPLPSIGIEALTVDVLLGGKSAAGLAATPGESQTAAASRNKASDAGHPAQRATDPPREMSAARHDVDAGPVRQGAAAAGRQHEQQAPEKASPHPLAAIVTPPAQAAATLPPAIQTDHVSPTSARQPKQSAEPARARPKPPVAKKRHSEPRKRKVAPTERERRQRRRVASVPSTAANGAGRGRSARLVTYAGLVAAHLARHKRYPAEARRSGSQGVATVSFAIDGGGRVTAVRLARTSGVPSIDREVQAMVRRSSPFPRPPDGRRHSFTVPVRFNLN